MVFIYSPFFLLIIQF